MLSFTSGKPWTGGGGGNGNSSDALLSLTSLLLYKELGVVWWWLTVGSTLYTSTDKSYIVGGGGYVVKPISWFECLILWLRESLNSMLLSSVLADLHAPSRVLVEVLLAFLPLAVKETWEFRSAKAYFLFLLGLFPWQAQHNTKTNESIRKVPATTPIIRPAIHSSREVNYGNTLCNWC